MQPEEMHRIHLPEWCKAAIARAKPKMDEIYERYIKPDAPVVALRDESKACLKEVNLMTKEQIHSKWIGVHPESRYGDGLVPADVIALVSDIFKQRFSLTALLDPTCTEVAPLGHKRTKKTIIFNDALVHGNTGQIPPLTEPPRYFSVTCGHTSIGFRCLLAGSPSENEQLIENGRLSLERLKQQQPTS